MHLPQFWKSLLLTWQKSKKGLLSTQAVKNPNIGFFDIGSLSDIAWTSWLFRHIASKFCFSKCPTDKGPKCTTPEPLVLKGQLVPHLEDLYSPPHVGQVLFWPRLNGILQSWTDGKKVTGPKSNHNVILKRW